MADGELTVHLILQQVPLLFIETVHIFFVGEVADAILRIISNAIQIAMLIIYRGESHAAIVKFLFVGLA